MTALFAALTAGGQYLTTGRRIIPWTQVTEQPALFLRHVGDHTAPRATGLPPKIVMECEVWIYSGGGANPDAVPETPLNYLLDGIDAALMPAPGFSVQTLGGLVTHAWVEGATAIHPGDVGAQAIAVVPVKILVPVIG